MQELGDQVSSLKAQQTALLVEQTKLEDTCQTLDNELKLVGSFVRGQAFGDGNEPRTILLKCQIIGTLNLSANFHTSNTTPMNHH